MRMNRMFLDGNPASAADLRALALANYGHFTTLQVRGGAARGVDLHLQRLRDATRELFGSDLDVARVRALACDALRQADAGDCTLRVTVFAPDFDPAAPPADCVPAVLVALAPPAAPPAMPVRLKSCRYARAAPHLKHVGTFPLTHHRRLAVQAGFDDALFVDAAGRISEGSAWNLGFWDGRHVLWPEAPALRGTCERLLQQGLEAQGVPQAVRAIDLAEVAGFRAAFACNSRGYWGIAAIDGMSLGADPRLQAALAAALASQPTEPL